MTESYDQTYAPSDLRCLFTATPVPEVRQYEVIAARRVLAGAEEGHRARSPSLTRRSLSRTALGKWDGGERHVF